MASCVFPLSIAVFFKAQNLWKVGMWKVGNWGVKTSGKWKLGGGVKTSGKWKLGGKKMWIEF